MWIIEGCLRGCCVALFASFCKTVKSKEFRHFCFYLIQHPICPAPVLWSMSSDMLIRWERCVPIVAPSLSVLRSRWRSWKLLKRKQMRRMEKRSCCSSSPGLSCCRWEQKLSWLLFPLTRAKMTKNCQKQIGHH